MKKILTRFSGLLVLLLLVGFGTPAFADSHEEDDSFAIKPICALYVEGDCLPYGPEMQRRKLEAQGIHYPIEPLNYQTPDYTLNYLPYLYGQVVTPRAPVYGSMEDASRAVNPIRRMEGDLFYVSYEFTDIVNDMRVYMIAPGVWMNAIDVHRIGSTVFQGLEFTRTPRNPFGWILNPVEVRSEPGYGPGSGTGIWYNRLDIVRAFGFETIDEMEWVQILPDQWIEKRYVALIHPQRTPPAEAIEDRWIDVNLYEQTVAVYEGGRLVFATIISSGIDPFWTRPGLFQIQEKLETTPMSGSFEADRSDYYYLEDVPWTMYFDEARAFHGAYWHNGYGYPRSHGCVNMSPADAQWLFNWAEIGDWVYVHDPSGQTPTDPSLYGSGGA